MAPTYVRQLVPQRAAGRVPETVKAHARRLHVLVRQAEAALDLVDHRSPAGVDAEVVERPAEVRPVRLHAAAGNLACNERQREQQLLREREDEGRDGGDVRRQRVAGDGQ